MSGTVDGGRKAGLTVKAKFGKDWYKTIGRRGGLSGGTGRGFADMSKERLSLLGALGGLNKYQNKVWPNEEAKRDYLNRKQIILDKIAAIDKLEKEQ